jgi:hypothetical protein
MGPRVGEGDGRDGAVADDHNVSSAEELDRQETGPGILRAPQFDFQRALSSGIPDALDGRSREQSA